MGGLPLPFVYIIDKIHTSAELQEAVLAALYLGPSFPVTFFAIMFQCPCLRTVQKA
jgi:hypothetical protein